MALDVVLLHAGANPATATPLRSISFDDDGYYWFLHPRFEELAQRTGKYIDLYGDAKFAVHELLQLRHLLAKAKSSARGKPTKWRVHVGTQTVPVERDLFCDVEKKRLENLLAEFESLLDECERIGGEIHCIGD